jgi:hypothetical protein
MGQQVDADDWGLNVGNHEPPREVADALSFTG